MAEEVVKPLLWIASSKRDLCEFPEGIRRECGFALYEAQRGAKHSSAKTMKGFRGPGVLEVVKNDEGGTYRVVYTVRFEKAVYVLHAFQKKSKSGIKTPKQEIEKVRARMKKAEVDYNMRFPDEGQEKEKR